MLHRPTAVLDTEETLRVMEMLKQSLAQQQMKAVNEAVQRVHALYVEGGANIANATSGERTKSPNTVTVPAPSPDKRVRELERALRVLEERALAAERKLTGDSGSATAITVGASRCTECSLTGREVISVGAYRLLAATDCRFVATCTC